MGRSDAGTDKYSGAEDEVPEHSATVGDFALDKYEVTVGRFRNFVANYDVWHKTNPSAGTGQHPKAVSTAWGQSWGATSGDLPTDSGALKDALKCSSSYQTWTDTAGTNESYPINCVSWYEAFAFCIWDGGRLPTEAEYEYAAAGGQSNRLYPWGDAVPDGNLANYYGNTPAGTPFCSVGSKLATGGTSVFGHADLAGSMWEWVFDWYDSAYYAGAGNVCNNCANAFNSSYRVIRGGGWGSTDADKLRAAKRNYYTPTSRFAFIGFRCVVTDP